MSRRLRTGIRKTIPPSTSKTSLCLSIKSHIAHPSETAHCSVLHTVHHTVRQGEHQSVQKSAHNGTMVLEYAAHCVSECCVRNIGRPSVQHALKCSALGNVHCCADFCSLGIVQIYTTQRSSPGFRQLATSRLQTRMRCKKIFYTHHSAHSVNTSSST